MDIISIASKTVHKFQALSLTVRQEVLATTPSPAPHVCLAIIWPVTCALRSQLQPTVPPPPFNPTTLFVKPACQHIILTVLLVI